VLGARLTTPTVQLTEPMRAQLVETGGFTHPLFTDPEVAQGRPSFAGRPFPGQALLLVLGGLVEQTGVFDDIAVALIGYDTVRFRAPAYPGDHVHAEVEVWRILPMPNPRRMTLLLDCAAKNQDGQTLATFTMNMLCRTENPA
jgi:acyl dehydratase